MSMGYYSTEQERLSRAASRPPKSRWALWLHKCAALMVAIRRDHAETKWEGQTDCPVCQGHNSLRANLSATGALDLHCETPGCVDSACPTLNKSS